MELWIRSILSIQTKAVSPLLSTGALQKQDTAREYAREATMRSLVRVARGSVDVTWIAAFG